MKAQRVRLPETNRATWLVLDDDFVPVQPILTYLRFLHDLDRSPHTIRASAHHLKLFWEYLRDEHIDWTEINVAQLAGFITWLRRQNPTVITLEPTPARRTNATIDLILSAVHGFYSFHMRLARSQNALSITWLRPTDDDTSHSCTALPKRNQNKNVWFPSNESGGFPKHSLMSRCRPSLLPVHTPGTNFSSRSSTRRA